IYKKLRDKVVYVPFGEFRGATAGRAWERTATLLQVTALYLPVGLLAANLPGRLRRYADSLPKVFAASVVLACGSEAIELVVQSRTSSAMDVAVGAPAATLGWVIGTRFPRSAGISPAIVLGLVWFAAVAVICWQPFAFTGQTTPFDW